MTSTSTSQQRWLPSQLTLLPVGPGDEDLVRLFFPENRLRDLLRTGVLGPPDADGLVDISIDQFVSACVQEIFSCAVTVDAQGDPLTLYYLAMVDEHTGTGGCLNAPGVPGGRGAAAAGTALALDRWLTGEVHAIAMSVFDWNTASLTLIERFGFTPTSLPSEEGEELLYYVLKAEQWPGSAVWEARATSRVSQAAYSPDDPTQ